ANTVSKDHFTPLYSPARQRAFTKKNITAAWAGSGLFLLNPDRVLRGIPKPPAEINVPRANKVELCPQDEVPQTPVTPVTAEALTLLHNLIKQDTHALTETKIQRLQKHV
ncbi:hypothetical protein P154DRAFT_36465, partial [Amniculicola lignicola CBS 123094]